MGGGRRSIIPIFIPHQACPHRCIFCDQHTISGKKTAPGLDEVSDTVTAYLATMPADRKKEIAFFGGSFTGLPLKVQEMYLRTACKYLQCGLVDGIRVSTRPDYIDAGRINLLRQYQVDTVELGVQSFDDRALAASERNHSSEHSVRAFELLKRNGFKVGIQLMPGLPASNEQSDLLSGMKTAELCPDFCRIYPTLVVQGTKLEQYYRTGQYLPLTLERAVNLMKQIYLQLYQKGIPVIRMGLHPSKQLAGATVAGAYHPALGYLVKSRIYYDMARSLILASERTSTQMVLNVHPSEYSLLVGLRKINVSRLRLEFAPLSVEAAGQERCHPGQIILAAGKTKVGAMNICDLIGKRC